MATLVDLGSEEQLINNPVIQKLMHKFFSEQFKNIQMLSNQAQNTQNQAGREQSKAIANHKMIKSPSDTTIYVPALTRKLVTSREKDCALVCPQQDGTISQLVKENLMQDSQHPNLISNFVETIRAENHPEDGGPIGRPSNETDNLESAQKRAERTLLEAEKFKAVIEPPGRSFIGFGGSDHAGCDQVEALNISMSRKDIPGDQRAVFARVVNDESNLQKDLGMLDIGSGVSDDEFFHLMCHIEPNLIHKIEKGEFVELEKLLPKDKIGGSKDEGRLEWVQRDGGTYLVPVQKDNKISGFRHWEQAFRAYAMIYCGANPHRSKEI